MDRVTLIAGRMNNNIVNYWKVENIALIAKIGDFAIVENMNSYTLVEIVGVVITTKEKAPIFSNTKYENMKRMIKNILLEDLKKLSVQAE